MLKFVTTKQFEKDYKKTLKSGKNKEKIVIVIQKLVNQEPLEAKYKNHKLKGEFVGRRECHLEPDLLLTYKLEKERIIFERMGPHSQLFK